MSGDWGGGPPPLRGWKIAAAIILAIVGLLLLTQPWNHH